MAFKNSNQPSAKIADGRLILSLPDAETPALWMMPLDDATTSVLRLETDAKGLLILKKHGGKGTAETIAVYRDRSRAAAALAAAAAAMEKARNTRPLVGPNAQPVIVNTVPRYGKWFIYLVMFWFLLSMLSLDKIILRAVITPFLSDDVTAALQAQQAQQLQQYMQAQQGSAQPAEAQPAQPQVAPPRAPGAPLPAGVPMSADDFLSNPQAGQ